MAAVVSALRRAKLETVPLTFTSIFVLSVAFSPTVMVSFASVPSTVRIPAETTAESILRSSSGSK